MAQLGDLITSLANREQERGINAVVDALKEAGVLQFNSEQHFLHFTAGVVSGEWLSRRIDENLKRS